MDVMVDGRLVSTFTEREIGFLQRSETAQQETVDGPTYLGIPEMGSQIIALLPQLQGDYFMHGAGSPAKLWLAHIRSAEQFLDDEDEDGDDDGLSEAIYMDYLGFSKTRRLGSRHCLLGILHGGISDAEAGPARSLKPALLKLL